MSGEIEAAIEKLEGELELEERAFREAERNVYGRRVAINSLLSVIGQPPRYPTDSADGPARRATTAGAGGSTTPKPAGGATMTLRPDTFYGKRQQSAIREFLEMRKTAGLGTATPRQIFEALRDGGYQFDTKDDQVAMIGIRALLRKRTAFFHKLPNGTYGLTAWYPDAKKNKVSVANGSAQAPSPNSDLTDDEHADEVDEVEEVA